MHLFLSLVFCATLLMTTTVTAEDTIIFTKNTLLDNAKLIEEKAKQGHAQSQYSMGIIRYRGAIVIEQDYHEAFIWYKKAANQGHKKSQKKLDDLLKNKIIIEQ